MTIVYSSNLKFQINFDYTKIAINLALGNKPVTQIINLNYYEKN